MAYPRATREQVLNIKDIKEVEIDVPAWEMSILVRSISALERARIIKQSTDKDGTLDTSKFQTMIIVTACVEPKFEKADTDALGAMAAGTIASLAEEIVLASGFSTTAEEAEKNS